MRHIAGTAAWAVGRAWFGLVALVDRFLASTHNRWPL